MIKEYTLRLKRRGGEAPLEYADAYPLYAALLELAGTRTAQNLHEEGRPSLSQYLMPMEKNRKRSPRCSRKTGNLPSDRKKQR